MYGLIGNPIKHSFSADFFNSKFKREGIDEEYRLFQLEKIDDLKELLAEHKDLKGLNVTIPFKQQVIPYLDRLSDEAREIGAVNVIKISEGGHCLEGFNSDAVGFRDSIKPLLRPHMRKALILGTGGASRAVEYVLRKEGLEVMKVSRKGKDGLLSYSDMTQEVMSEFHVIVNTTPLGMWPKTDTCPDIPYPLLTPGHLCFDLVYNPETTLFMHKASEMGATVKNGLEMLHGQAIAAWKIWNSQSV